MDRAEKVASSMWPRGHSGISGISASCWEKGTVLLAPSSADRTRAGEMAASALFSCLAEG